MNMGVMGTPGSSDSWEPFASGLRARGQWTSNPMDNLGPYTINDVVSYLGSSYVRTGSANPEETNPPTNEDGYLWPNWELLASKGDTGPAAEETTFVVAGGTSGDQPTFDGDPLFSGSYIKNGSQVHFQIQVDMDNITSFGTGQYYVELPFPAKYSYHFRDACLHDNSGTVRQYALSGHVYAGQSQVTLWFTSTSGQDELFDYNSPALLTVNDNFHISGTYIALPSA
jgi:hypothetical protein